MPKPPLLLHVKSFLASPWGYTESVWNAAKRTGLTRWGNAANLRDEWDARTALIGSMIAPGASVLEFGSGNERLGGFLPEGCEYQPSDIVARSEKTLVCDLNQSFPKLDRKWDYIVFSGVLEYIHDIPALLRQVRASCHASILSYATIDALECMTTRMRGGWVNHFSKNAFEAMLKDAGFEIEETRFWNGQEVYTLR